MAIFKALTFDGVNSLDYGIYITGEAVYNAPERAVEMVNIPGKNGALALDQGRFENIEVTYHAGCFADSQSDFADKVMRFRNALASRYTYKRLTDEYHPDEYRLGLYKSGLDVDAVRYGTAGEFNITFDCKPQRFLTSGEEPEDYVPGQSPADEQTVTGSIVSFEAEEDTIISDLVADIEPVQDLHGYDKPWAGGNGKNLLSMTVAGIKAVNTSGTWSGNGYTYKGVTFSVLADSDNNVTGVKTSGTANDTALFGLGSFNAISGTSYTINGSPSGKSDSTYRLWGEGTAFPAGNRISDDRNERQTATAAATESTPIVLQVFSGVNANNLTFYPMVRIASDTDSTFAPYTNICPISGCDGVTVTRAGKNLFGGVYDEFFPLHFNVDTQVTASADTRGGNGNIQIAFYDSNKSQIDYWGLSAAGTRDQKTFTYPATAYYVKFIRTESTNYQIELGSTATAYEPYDGDTYTIALGQTVYGGTLDVTSGVLKVCPYYASYNGETLTGEWVSDRDEYSPNTSPTIGAQVVNVGGSLSTVQLTPTEVKTLLGTNNVWADSGNVTVKYGTNPYIIINPTDFPSKPLLEVTGTGSFWLGDTLFTITGTAGQTIYIDCETGECYKENGGIISSANGLVTLNRLDFPELTSGITNIQLGSGISKVKITPRWWRL